ncbi:MAG: peptidoglycan DD-metalloendopeptidase family protein, partial [Lentilitoribacter sp.]
FTILIRHEGGFVSVYAHNNRLLASRGDTVKAGDVIAESGMTGNAKLPMLHFELRSNAVPKNPLDFLKSHSGKPGASDNSKLEPQNKSVIPSFTGSKTKSKRNQEIQSTIQNNPVGRLRSIVAMPLFGPERKLIESSAEMPIYPASLVKLATLKVLFEAMEAGTFSLDTEFVVSENAQRQVPSKIGLRSDTRVRVEDLIQMITTKNGNDAAVVIAEGVSGSVEKFVIDMNTMARQLGLESTHFSNPTGLPGRDQYSTTADIARLVRSIRKRHPAMSKYFSIAKFTWGKATFHNHNLLLNSVEGVDGMLTGYTRRSGFNMAVTVARENGDYVIVVTGAKTGKQRNMLAADSIKQIYSE